MSAPKGSAERLGAILRDIHSTEEQPELLMPVSDEHAYRQIEIEAMRGIRDALRSLQDDARLDREDRKEDRRLLQNVHERVVRIESNKIDRTVEKLGTDVETLKAERERRLGAVSLVEWLSKFGPWLLALALAILALVGFTRAT